MHAVHAELSVWKVLGGLLFVEEAVVASAHIKSLVDEELNGCSLNGSTNPFRSFSDDSRNGLVHILARFLSGKASVPIEHHFEFCVSSIYIWCSRGELQTTNTATAHCFSTL